MAPWVRHFSPSAARAGLTGLLAVLLPAALLLARRSRLSDEHRRGTRIIDGRRAQRRGAHLKRRGASVVTLAGIAIASSEETKHFKLIGTTGTGKSTAIGELLGAALARGDRAVIADPHGAYRARLFRPFRGDVLLNPFEPASVRWDPFAEILAPGDAEQLAGSLIPSTGDASGREWRGYARTFLTAVLRRCHEGRRDAAELWRLIAVADSAELRSIVCATPAQPFLEPENARMFGSIRSVAASSAAALEHVGSQRARAFSVRSWVRDGRGVLFLPYQAGQIAALRAVIAAWVRLAVFETMSVEGDRRLWFVVDELDALGAIDGLKDALARLRKFGGRCVLGFQSIAQVSSTYGAGEAQTIVENCGNTLILRCSASERGGTAEFASRLIGEHQVVRRLSSRGRDGMGGLGQGTRRARSSLHVSEQQVIEAAVLASQIEQLPDFSGFLKTAGSPVWLNVRFGCAP